MQMLTRFSLYGFLKNLNFAEPFLILFYLSIGLNYLQIGILVAFLNICINFMEIPSGAIADIYGRKNSMLLSLTSYIGAFIIFAFSNSYEPLFAAVFLFSIGESFRTGTHKAMIFDWLRQNNRLKEKTMVYGYTRSWSKYGSALAVIVSSAIVILTSNYRWIFLFSIIPYIAGLWNLALYPDYLNNRIDGDINIGVIFKHTFRSVKNAFGKTALRRLIVKSMGFEGVFDITKNFLQPVLQAQAIVIAAMLALSEKDSTAIVVGAVYFVLHIISASASKRAHIFAGRFKSENIAITTLIFTGAALAFLSSAGMYINIFTISIAAYILYYIIQNLWRPILVAIYDNHADNTEQATILSIDSQAKTAGITVMAPVAGFIADKWGIEGALLLSAVIMLLLGIFSMAGDRKEMKQNHLQA
jgi:MFS family permease